MSLEAAAPMPPDELIHKWSQTLHEDTTRLVEPAAYVAREAAAWGYQQALMDIVHLAEFASKQ